MIADAVVPKGQQPCRPPVSTYEQAVWRLAGRYFTANIGQDGLDFAIELIADIFWVTPQTVTADMQKRIREVVNDKRGC